MKLFNVVLSNNQGQLVEGQVISTDEGQAYKAAYDMLQAEYIRQYELQTGKKYKKDFSNEMTIRMRMIQEQSIELTVRK